MHKSTRSTFYMCTRKRTNWLHVVSIWSSLTFHVVWWPCARWGYPCLSPWKRVSPQPVWVHLGSWLGREDPHERMLAPYYHCTANTCHSEKGFIMEQCTCTMSCCFNLNNTQDLSTFYPIIKVPKQYAPHYGDTAKLLADCNWIPHEHVKES